METTGYEIVCRKIPSMQDIDLFTAIVICQDITQFIPTENAHKRNGTNHHPQNTMKIEAFLMAYLHCWTWIQVPTPIRIPNPMATLYYAEHDHIAWTLIQIPIQSPNTTVPIFRTDICTRIGIPVRVWQCE